VAEQPRGGRSETNLSSYAELDLDRARRRGFPEAVFCAGKTPAQVAGIAEAVRARPDVITLFTRATPDHASAVLSALPDAHHDPDAGLLAWPPNPPEPFGGRVVVLAAGTSDLSYAREAMLTARYLGRDASLIVDVGVAGLHRVLARLEHLRAAQAIVVAAGMDGALPSVVAGLVSAPVIALPTSVGYGAAFEGLAALLAMLNACAPGVAVVNIDNGYGAGHLAAQITAPHPTPTAPSAPQLAATQPTAPQASAPQAAGPEAPAQVAGQRATTHAEPQTTAQAAEPQTTTQAAEPQTTAPVAGPRIAIPQVEGSAVDGGRHAWIDASAGVAGDMLLGALLDAGARLDAVRRAVDAVVPGGVSLSAGPVTRAGLRALKAGVELVTPDPPHRTWRDIRAMLEAAALPAGVRRAAVAVFTRLADAEASVHGVPAQEVHFHEVGALDSIADVVGVCAALDDLGVTSVSAGEVALGSGRVRTAHGELPVPVPAVLELSRGWRVRAGGTGELATPTGMALIRALASRCEDLPPMTVEAAGVGAGGRDTPGRANAVRVVIGAPLRTETGRPNPKTGNPARPADPGTPAQPPSNQMGMTAAAKAMSPIESAEEQPATKPVQERTQPTQQPTADTTQEQTATQPAQEQPDAKPKDEQPAIEAAVLLEANVDDLDPRLWPGVLDGLLRAGAADAWLVPILMKKGRPAHTLTVLCAPDRREALRARIFRDTSTLGVRESPRDKTALPRTFRGVGVAGGTVSIKVGHVDGVITQVMPEFADVAALARDTGRAERVLLQEALSAAAAAGLTVGAALPQ
jgi:uncharacterized protein (DUF111 family)/NCAIR mutase (PurE)-related protein